MKLAKDKVSVKVRQAAFQVSGWDDPPAAENQSLGLHISEQSNI